MNLATIASAPWAILRADYDRVQAVLARHFAGESADLAAIEAATGKPLANAPTPMSVSDGVATIALDGVLSKRINMLSQISGGTSTQIAGGQFDAAMADDSVKAIVLAIDSPGGTVDGAQELADKVASARGVKPVTAVIDGMGCSAAYWIASGASEIYIAGDTTMVGSIGVIASHTDYSGAEAARGVRTTEVVAGKYKNSASAHAPLSDQGKALLQSQVDHIYGVFLGTVARNRGVSAEVMHEAGGDGRVFLGKQAISAGLVDGIATLPTVVRKAAARALPSRDTPAAAAARPAPLSPGDLHRAALRRVAEMRALGVHLTFAAALAAASSEQ